MTLEMAYDSVQLNDYFICLCDSRPLPTFQNALTTVDGRDGAFLEEQTLGPRRFTVTLIAKAKKSTGIQKAARQLMRIMSVREPKHFRFGDEWQGDSPLYRLAVPTGDFDVEEFVRAGRWTCHFIQPDPYLYGKRVSMVLEPRTAKIVTVGGNAPVLPVADSHPTGSVYTISAQSDTVDAHVEYKAPFNGNNLYLDFERQVARLVPAIPKASGLQLGSEFFEMEGRMVLTASHRTTIAWRERWL